jgi:hypothetical protein
MSQMWVEGTLGIVPALAPKIMLNEEGENITLSNNLEMFKKWADFWGKEIPCESVLAYDLIILHHHNSHLHGILLDGE